MKAEPSRLIPRNLTENLEPLIVVGVLINSIRVKYLHGRFSNEG